VVVSPVHKNLLFSSFAILDSLYPKPLALRYTLPLPDCPGIILNTGTGDLSADDADSIDVVRLFAKGDSIL
jgi:hypothetical protein